MESGNLVSSLLFIFVFLLSKIDINCRLDMSDLFVLLG
jgi:hypothetical protein